MRKHNRQDDAMTTQSQVYVLPWEDTQVRRVMDTGSFMGKLLIVEREWVNDRMTVILVRQPIGI